MAQVKGTTVGEKEKTESTEKTETTESTDSKDSKSLTTGTVDDSTGKDTSTTGVSGDDYKVGDYGIFSNGVATTQSLGKDVETLLSTMSTQMSKLSDQTVFMGPICDSCVEGFSKVNTNVTLLSENLTSIANYLIDVASNYKAGDESAMNKILTLDATTGKLMVGTGGVNGVTADGNTIVTVDQVQNCQDVQEYLDLVMPIYSYYAKKYGIKYPGVLALQPVHEHSAPTGIQAQSAVEDNNLGGLKYGDSIPNATPGSYPSDGTGGQYSHFNNVTEYIEAACWNIAEGDY